MYLYDYLWYHCRYVGYRETLTFIFYIFVSLRKFYYLTYPIITCMRKYSDDERALLIGAAMSAGVAGIGIYELLVALSASDMSGYIGTMIIGAMLFNAGVSGMTAVGAMWTNYQAIL